MRQFSLSKLPSIPDLNLPVSIRNEVEMLPVAAQEDFFRQYGREMKVLGLAYITHLLGGSSYIYQGKVFKQLLFWFTGLGFGVGWVINLFRMPDMVREVNRKIARKIIRDLSRRHGIQQNRPMRPFATPPFGQRPTVTNTLRPRPVRPDYDPIHPTVESLQAGFLVDYRLKTWEVVSECQFDWYGGKTDRQLVLAYDIERVCVYISFGNGIPVVFDMKQLNVYALDRNMVNEINLRGKPSNVIQFQGTDYYRDAEQEGICFFYQENVLSKKVKSWEYVDLTRTQFLRVEQFDKNDYRAYAGNVVSDMEFQEILPKKVMSE